MKLTMIVCFFLLIAGIGCGGSDNKSTESEKAATTEDTNVVKVYVEKTGQALINGQPATIAEIDSSFKELSLKKGTVYYSRDNSSEDPPKEAMEIIDLVAKYSLPVAFYTDKTFSQRARQ